MYINEDKLSEEYLNDLENNGTQVDMKEFKELLKNGVSEADLDCASAYLYLTMIRAFEDDDFKKNTLSLFKLLYKKYIKKIIENIGDSEYRYRLVDYIIKSIRGTPKYSGNASELFDIIIYYGFDNIDFNHTIIKNIDFKKLNHDKLYLKPIEKIYTLIAEYSYSVRNNDDEEVKKDQEFGMNRIYEYIRNREKGDRNFYQSSFLFDCILMHASEAYADKEEVDPTLFEYIKRCVKIRTKQPNFNLNEDRGISDLLQIINSPRIELKQVRELSEIINSNLRTDEIDKDMAIESAHMIMKKESLSEEELEELFKEIQDIKLTSNGVVPNDIVEYLLSELLNKESALYKNPNYYFEYICRIFESLGSNTLPQEIKDKKPYFYFVREFIDIGDPYGTQSGNIVYLGEEVESVLETTDTIFHENTHIEQEHHYDDEEQCLYTEYMALKENILANRLINYQADNYSSLFLEINAREKSALRTVKFLMNSERLKNRVGTRAIEDLKKKYMAENAQYIGAYSKKAKKDGSEQNVNEIFAQNLIPKNLKEHPILLLEYNEDCTQKTPEQIIESIEQTESKNKKSLLAKILKNNGVFKQENIYKDALYLIDYSPKNKDTEKILKYVIGSTFIRMLYNQYERYAELDDSQKGQFIEIINRASNKITNEPESVFSRGISRVDRKGNNMMKTFELIRKFVNMQNPVIQRDENEK